MNILNENYFRILKNFDNSEYRIQQISESWFSRLFMLDKFSWKTLYHDGGMPYTFYSLEEAKKYIDKQIYLANNKLEENWRVLEQNDKN